MRTFVVAVVVIVGKVYNFNIRLAFLCGGSHKPQLITEFAHIRDEHKNFSP